MSCFWSVFSYVRSQLRHKSASLSDIKNAIYNLTSDVTVMSPEMELAPNLLTISVRYSGGCVQGFAFLRLCVAKILREK